MASSRPQSTTPGPWPPHSNQQRSGSAPSHSDTTSSTSAAPNAEVDDMPRAVSQAVAALNSVSTQINARSGSVPSLVGCLQPLYHTGVFAHMDVLKGRCEKEGEAGQTAIAGLKRQIYEDLPEKARCELLPGLEEFMRELVAEQVQKTVDASIGDFIAIPLAEQKEGAAAMAQQIDVELDNSKARLENSRLHPDDTDPFKPVLKKDGTASKVWPFDYRSLFAFEGDFADKALDELLRDFGLSVGAKEEKGVKFQDNVKKVKLQTFLAHIGAPVDVLHFV
ncbi:hypothetical protein HDZ31DRAFT_34708 [Schizophyllum fasciatum]